MNSEHNEKYRISYVTSLILICCTMIISPVNAELFITNEFDNAEVPLRILADNDPDIYWIVSRLEGLYRLSEDQPGIWNFELFENTSVIDAAGPTSNGIIYCTAETDAPEYLRHIAVFDTSLNQFIDTISLPWDYSIDTIAVSEDEQYLYFTVDTTDPDAFRTMVAPEDSGLIVEMDIATESVTRTVAIQPWAHTIHVWNDTTIFTSCDFWRWSWDQSDAREEMKSTTQVIDLISFTRINQYASGHASPYNTNAFLEWDENTIALLNRSLYGDFEDPQFEDAIWLLNPATGSVINTIGIQDDMAIDRGVHHACISNVRENILYVASGVNPREYTGEYPLLVTDLEGNYLTKAMVEVNFHPIAVLEIDDGHLIVTGFWRDEESRDLSGKIYILEWVNNPPTCDLQVITQLPYLGPSPAAIEFDASGSFDPDPGDILTFEWDFDGDLIFNEPVDDSYTGDPDNPTHEYTETYHGFVFVKVLDLNDEESICHVQVDVEII